MPEQTRKCRHCQQDKPLSEIRTDKRLPSGYTSTCKACFNERRAKQARKRRAVAKPRERKRVEDAEYYECLVCDASFASWYDKRRGLKDRWICQPCSQALSMEEESTPKPSKTTQREARASQLRREGNLAAQSVAGGGARV